MIKNPFVKVGVLGLALCMALVTPGCGVCGFGPGQVLIRDPQLEVALRQALSVPFACITRADMLRLTELDASSFGIRYLDGLETATNVVNLDLSNNFIQDISAIKDLDNLVSLNLANNGITNIDAISDLNSLRFLDFTCNTGVLSWDPVAAVVTTNSGFLEGGTVTIDKESVTLTCQVVDEEGNVEEFECYTSNYEAVYGAVAEYSRINNLHIDLILGYPEGTSQCGF